MDASRDRRGCPGRDAERGRRSVTLVRGSHRWRFECEKRDIGALVKALDEITSRPGSPLDEFDAALVVQEFEQRAGGTQGMGTGPA